MFLAVERQSSRVHVSKHRRGIFKPSERLIRVRKIVLHGVHLFLYCAMPGRAVGRAAAPGPEGADEASAAAASEACSAAPEARGVILLKQA